jgi:hypothetical protein
MACFLFSLFLPSLPLFEIKIVGILTLVFFFLFTLSHGNNQQVCFCFQEQRFRHYSKSGLSGMRPHLYAGRICGNESLEIGGQLSNDSHWQWWVGEKEGIAFWKRN